MTGPWQFMAQTAISISCMRRTRRRRYTVYLLYWYKSRNTDAARHEMKKGAVMISSKGQKSCCIPEKNGRGKTCHAGLLEQAITTTENAWKMKDGGGGKVLLLKKKIVSAFLLPLPPSNFLSFLCASFLGPGRTCHAKPMSRKASSWGRGEHVTLNL